MDNMNRNDLPMSEEDRKKANTLCIISTILLVAPKILSCIGTFISSTITGEHISKFLYSALATRMVSSMMSALYGLSSLCTIASLVLMIIVRVKYPKSTYGKVLMWIFIILGIIMILAFLMLLAFCISCSNSLKGCPG